MATNGRVEGEDEMHSVLQEDPLLNGRQIVIDIQGAGLRAVAYIGEHATHLSGAHYDATSGRYERSFGGVRVLPGNPSLDLIEHYVLFGIEEYMRGIADGRNDFKAEVRALFADRDS